MFKWIDQSPALAKLITQLSATLAKQRGLPVLIGIFLIAVSFIISLLDVLVESQILAFLWSITHHLGIIVALIGILLVEPLGR